MANTENIDEFLVSLLFNITDLPVLSPHSPDSRMTNKQKLTLDRKMQIIPLVRYISFHKLIDRHSHNPELPVS